MNSFRSFAICVFLIAVVLSLIQLVSASPLCPGSHQTEQDLSKCKYGTAVGWCGNLECAKGPGERCGGNWLEHGSCGEGMYCGCGYCAGCYIVKCAPRLFC
ncbi:neuroparsin-A-like [Macrobrachium rosenbergii]|uniref:neuroparsin-A-like n=1 Tax=Macrobrachium rosenbergii TaxID=79674 RepID=UPI0034D3CD31